MPVVVAVVEQPAAQVALVAAAKAAPRLLGHKVLTMATMEPQIPAVAAVVKRHALTLLARSREAPAALASSSSSTTSALPQSLPSSHRRSGLHQRVR
jgi:hypothetical protein